MIYKNPSAPSAVASPYLCLPHVQGEAGSKKVDYLNDLVKMFNNDHKGDVDDHEAVFFQT